MEILHRDALKQGGFAGVREHQLVKDNKLFGAPPKPGQGWSGIGNFVYLADARFIPHGETGMHPHKEVDVISVMVSGRISHAGSLEHGQELHAFDVQVQRAGGEGFYHNEINPDPTENRMLQLWVLPEEAGQKAGYKMYQPEQGRMGLVYGGADDQTDTFAAKTRIEIGRLKAGNRVDFSAPFLAYLSLGTGIANGLEVKAGHLFKDNRLDFEAKEDALLIVITN
jgi:hypothetical protein